LRTALTGTHLLTTGELVTDVNELFDAYGFGEARELVAKKRAGEKVLLSATDKARWLGHLERALAGLDRAEASSPLPTEPTNREALNRWLIDTRARGIS
jgi:hypothetical protein